MTSLDMQIEELIRESNAYMDKSIKTITAQNVEIERLKSQVNELRRCLNGDIKGGFLFNMSTRKGRVEFYEKKNAILDKTPEQCLNDVKAEAYEEGFRYSCGVYNGDSSPAVIEGAVRVYKDVLDG